jgi:hypothetical protein
MNEERGSCGMSESIVPDINSSQHYDVDHKFVKANMTADDGANLKRGAEVGGGAILKCTTVQS